LNPCQVVVPNILISIYVGGFLSAQTICDNMSQLTLIFSLCAEKAIFITSIKYIYIYTQDIKSYCLDIRGDFPYPIIADETRELAVKLDMIDEYNKNNEAEAMTVRALYIIGPDHKLRLSMLYPASTGRNVELVDYQGLY
jgi:hypothetical protein